MASQSIQVAEGGQVFKTDFSPSGNEGSMASTNDPRLATAIARDGADTRPHDGEKENSAGGGAGEATRLGAGDQVRGGQTAAWWYGWDGEKGGCGFLTKGVTFNGKTSVTFVPYSDEVQKKGPTKTLNRLNNKKTDITLPNGTKTWFVLWGDDHMAPPKAKRAQPTRIQTPKEAERLALREEHYILRGQTPLDTRYVQVRVVEVKDGPLSRKSHSELHVEQVFLWGGCVAFIERTLEVVKTIPRKGDDLSKFSPYVGAWVWARQTMCEEITKAAFHPDRVERMEATYGDEWDDSFHTTTGVGKAEPDAWERRVAREEAERERKRREDFWKNADYFD